MKKSTLSLILLLIVIIITSLLFKSNNTEKNIIVKNKINITENNNIKENNLNLKNNIFSNSKPVLTQKIEEKENIINHVKKTEHLTYLAYRETNYQTKQKQLNQYLTHQSKLKHIREGGVQSDLQREKRNHEIQFQKQYTSIMMSQQREREEIFLRQNNKVKERREQMHSLKQRQILQTKYRGEL